MGPVISYFLYIKIHEFLILFTFQVRHSDRIINIDIKNKIVESFFILC